ncbi:MAG: hypothetical protein ACJ71E_13140 [Nitrososphaeraceae archaeon]
MSKSESDSDSEKKYEEEDDDIEEDGLVEIMYKTRILLYSNP